MDFKDLVGLTADPAFVIGESQQLVAANEAAARLAGRPVEELIGRTCSDVISALHPGGERMCSSANCPVYQSMVRREPVSLGWTSWATPDGQLLPISGIALAAPSPDPGAEHDGTALVIVHLGVARSTAEPALELHVLGSTVLFANGEKQPLPRRRRAIELLAYLALIAPHGAHRDQLLEVFWPGAPEEESAPRLRVLVHALRQVLAAAGIEEALERRGSLYVLDTRDIRLDALDFEARAHGVLRSTLEMTDLDALERALQVYGGDLGASERFGEWATAETERLRRMYHDVLRRAAQYFAQRGAIDRSVECCEIALRSDPLQEQFQIALIAYYGHLGRREDAQRQYEDYRRILATQVGATPPAGARQALERALAATA